MLGIDCTHVKCLTKDTIVAVATNILTGAHLTIEVLPAETAFRIEEWIRELAESLGAEILVTDDADSMKNLADGLALQHQICRAPVICNIHDLVMALGTKALDHPDRVPWERPGLTVDQFLEDIETVEDLIKGLPGNGQVQMTKLAERYQSAPLTAKRAREHVVSHAVFDVGLVRKLGALEFVSALAFADATGIGWDKECQ